MNEPTYRIKPLVWKSKTGPAFEADTPLGLIVVYYGTDGRYHLIRPSWSHEFCDSIDHGKALAEQWLREKLTEALEVVE